MKRLTLNALTVSAFLLLCGPTLKAQEPRAKPAPPKLAIEIDGRRSDHPVEVGGEMEMGVSTPRPPGREQTAGGPPPLTGVRFKSAYEGDAVRVRVSVVFDDSQSVETPGPKYGRKEQHLAAYLVREGETVKIEEFARFGVAPLSFKVVRAKPRPEIPALASAPQVANNLKSVEVVSFEPHESPASRNRYKLRLRNITERDITALELYETRPGGRSTMTMAGEPGRPIIRAGDFYETGYNFSVDGRTTPQGFVQDADRQRTLFVGMVMYDDGTYEGTAETAASIMAGRRGGQIQRARVAPLLQSFLDAPLADAPSALEKLKAAVALLRVDVEPGVIAELRAQFPAPAVPEGEQHLARDADKRLAESVMAGLKFGKLEVLGMITQWEEMRAREPDTFDLRRHLSAFKENLEKRDARR